MALSRVLYSQPAYNIDDLICRLPIHVNIAGVSNLSGMAWGGIIMDYGVVVQISLSAISGRAVVDVISIEKIEASFLVPLFTRLC